MILNVPVPESDIVNTVEQAFEFKEQVGYPLIVRPAFTMGGTGGGICHNDAELKEVVMVYTIACYTMFNRKINRRL